MKINNREFREWTADDLQVLLNNDAYRENNFVDYLEWSFAVSCDVNKNPAGDEYLVFYEARTVK